MEVLESPSELYCARSKSEVMAELRDNLRETENVSLLSRLVGGGASLQLNPLRRKFPVSEKYTGKIACTARSFAGSFQGKTDPARLSTDPVKSTCS